MMLDVRIPHEPFNTLVRKKQAGEVLGRILEELKPEAVYFAERDGTRSVLLIIDIKDPSQLPTFAEPFFLNFNADCKLHVVMSPEDLGKAGLDELADKWG